MTARTIALALVVLAVLAATPAAAEPTELDVNVTSQADDGTFLSAPNTPEPLHEVYDNPHGATNLTVGIHYADDGIASKDDDVAEALDYWEDNAIDYAGYPVVFDLQPDAPAPDISVTFHESMTACGYTYNVRIVGCAPIIEEPYRGTAWMDIQADQRELVLTLKHEMGHLLGLGHDDEPQDIMGDTAEARTAR